MNWEKFVENVSQEEKNQMQRGSQGLRDKNVRKMFGALRNCDTNVVVLK